MTLAAYLKIIRKRWYVLVAAILLGGGAGAAVSYTATPMYDSTASVYFAVEAGQTASAISQSGTFAQSQMPTFASFADLPIVLDPVIKQLGLNTTSTALAGSVSAAASTDTAIIVIKASNANPQQAARIANAVATQLGTTVTNLSVKSVTGAPTVVARTVAPAVVGTAPVSPRTQRNIAAGLLAGLLIGFLIAYGWERLDNRVRTGEDAVDLAKSPMLGQIWTDRGLSKGHQVMTEDPHGALAEAIRSLRTNLQFLRIDGKPLTAIVTSAIPGEGKTTTAVSLAIALAETEAKVLLIDADLRRPSVATQLNLEGAAGLTTVLIGRATLDEVLQPWGDTGLDILPSGQIPPNPSELLGSRSMLELLEEVSSTYDFVLLDSAPLLPVTDTAVLAMSGVGVILVSAAGEVSRQQVRDAVASIYKVGGSTVGVVLNKLPPRAVKRATYTYGDAVASADFVPAGRPARISAAEPPALSRAQRAGSSANETSGLQGPDSDLDGASGTSKRLLPVTGSTAVTGAGPTPSEGRRQRRIQASDQ